MSDTKAIDLALRQGPARTAHFACRNSKKPVKCEPLRTVTRFHLMVLIWCESTFHIEIETCKPEDLSVTSISLFPESRQKFVGLHDGALWVVFLRPAARQIAFIQRILLRSDQDSWCNMRPQTEMVTTDGGKWFRIGF